MEWLNDNAGAVQALSTAVLVMVTAVYAGLVHWQVRETRRQGRPYVYIEVLKNTGFVETQIRNGGLRPAKKVTITVLKDIPIPDSEHRGFLGSPMLSTPIPVLAPNGQVKETVAHFRNVVGALRELAPDKRILAYKLAYDDVSENFEEKLEVDLSHPLGDERPFPEPTTYHAIYELRDHLTAALNRSGDILGEMAKTLRERSRS